MTETTRPYAGKYPGNNNYKSPWTEYIAKLEGLTDEGFFIELERMIWLSSYAASNRYSDYHTQLDICCDELRHRQGDKWLEVYEEAYNQAFGD